MAQSLHKSYNADELRTTVRTYVSKIKKELEVAEKNEDNDAIASLFSREVICADILVAVGCKLTKLFRPALVNI